MSLLPSSQACSSCGKVYPVSFLIEHNPSCVNARRIVSAEADRIIALKELDEIRFIGRQYYIIKNNEVFAINPQSGERFHYAPSTAGLTCVQIRALCGARVFASTKEAETYWAAIEEEKEEKKIVAEARYSPAEEKRLAAAAAAAATRKDCILSAM